MLAYGAQQAAQAIKITYQMIHGTWVAEAKQAVKTTRLVNCLRPNQKALSPIKTLFLKNHSS